MTGVSASAVPTRPRGPELVRFAVTGLAAYATDIAVFNLLLLGTGTPATLAKVVSSLAAIAVAFAGSRYYTWPDRRSEHPAKEYGLFLVFSLLAAGLQLLCLVVSHDLLGLTGAVADNVSANIVGMALATAFRFWTFRTYVFPPLAERPGAGDPHGG